jgi:hypothetical protein
MAYVYITIKEPRHKTRYQIGFIGPHGSFVTEHETINRKAAAARTSWLNGGAYSDFVRKTRFFTVGSSEP